MLGLTRLPISRKCAKLRGMNAMTPRAANAGAVSQRGANTMTDPIVLPNPETDNLKRCPKCGEWKLATLHFSPSKTSKSGFASWCRECHNTLNKLTRRAKAQVKAEKSREAARRRELEPPGLKACITCGSLKPDTLEYFCKNRTAKSGIAAQCRECRAAEHRQWRYDHPSKVVEEKRKWEKENPGLKRCTQCGEGKPPTLEYFAPNNRVPSGLQSWCRTCTDERQRLIRQEQKCKVREAARQWAIENPGMTRCSQCGETKPISEEFFRENKRAKSGFSSRCRNCDVGIIEPLRDKKIAYSRQWKRDNPDKVREAQRRWYRANADKVNERIRRWRHENPDKVREIRRCSVRNYRARKAKCSGKHTAADIRAQYKSQNGRCWWCGKKVGDKYEVDHRIPIARGGSNAPDNIVISCQKCNRSKNDKLPHEWNGRLL